MALVQGVFSNIGDVLILELNPTSAITSFVGFTDGTQNETVDRYFEKSFRYSNTGIYNGAWIPLTNPNITSIVADATVSYWFQIRYVRVGTDATQDLTWDFFNLNVTINPNGCPSIYGTFFQTSSIFDYITTCNTEWALLWGNLCDKMIKYGIIPEYIKRTEDFEHFYCTIVKFLSLNFVFAKQFGDIYITEKTLRENLLQRGVFLCGDESLTQLQAITNVYYEGMRQRGTLDVKPEIKRLLCIDKCDAFIMALPTPFETSWTVDNSSPCYKGTQGIRDINEMVEKTNDVVDLNNYYLWNSGQISIQGDVDNYGVPVDVMEWTNVFSQTGIGITQGGNINVDNFPDLITVDDHLDYEISMNIKVSGQINTLWFGVYIYDCDGVLLNAQAMGSGAPNNYFMANGNLPNSGGYFQLRGLLYNFNAQLGSAGGALPTGDSGMPTLQYLRMPQGAKYIYPMIKCVNGNGNNTFQIYNVKAGICAHQVPYNTNDVSIQVVPSNVSPYPTAVPSHSYAFVNTANFVLSYWSYNNSSFTPSQVDDKIEKYLIPMNCNLQTVSL